jgi:hypothetical protein
MGGDVFGVLILLLFGLAYTQHLMRVKNNQFVLTRIAELVDCDPPPRKAVSLMFIRAKGRY